MRGDRAIRSGIAILLVGVVAIVAGWAVRGEAQDALAPGAPPLTVVTPDGLEAAAVNARPVGRYQFAAPDLMLDTATGKLTTQDGQVLEGPIDASGKDVGHYGVAGYVTTVARSVGLDLLNQPTLSVEVVKGYVLGDTKNGLVVKQRIYSRETLRPGGL